MEGRKRGAWGAWSGVGAVVRREGVAAVRGHRGWLASHRPARGTARVDALCVAASCVHAQTITTTTTTDTTTTTTEDIKPPMVSKSKGTAEWPDSACPCRDDTRFCAAKSDPIVERSATTVCKANGWISGTMTSFCQDGCSTIGPGTYSVHSLNSQGVFGFETYCQPTDQSMVEYSCT